MTEQEQMAKIFKALCDPKRIAILQELQAGEQCACHIIEQLDIAQSALSYHMKILCESGLVDSWSVGKWTHYQLSQQGAQKAMTALQTITATKETTI